MPTLTHFFNTLRQHRLLPLVMVLLGAITPLSLAPYDIWPITLLTAGCFAELLQKHTPRYAAWLAWCFGFGLWASGASWLYVSIHDYGYTPAWLAVPMVAFVAAVMGLFFALLGYVFARFHWDRFTLLSFPALWVIGEWLRSWFLTGFPWLFSGYAFIETPLIGYAPLFGVFGVSFFVIFTAIALTQLAQYWKNWRLATAVIAIWLAGYGLQQFAWTKATGESLSVSIVQGNIPQESKWQLEWRDKTINIYRQLSETEWGRDLVIWPEAAIPMFFHEAQKELEEIENNALTGHSAFVTGIPYAEVDKQAQRINFYNSILAMGEGYGIYNKQRLVPFGEYIPLEDFLRGAIPFFDMPMTSFSRGHANQAPLRVQKMLMSPLICYEIAYPDLVRQAATRSDFLATISNDGWFGTSAGPYQHFDMVRMRAIETGREIIRATNNGISALIDVKGRVRSRAPQFERTVLRTQVHAYEGLTPYSVMGNMPVIILSVIILVSSARKLRKKSPKELQNTTPQ
jgi:apolipoprotein N-acyltransferase